MTDLGFNLNLDDIMKRIVLISLMLLTVLSVSAQSRRGFISTGDNVNVRKGPGINYPVLYSEGEKLQLFKGEVVAYKGKKRNGFIYVHVVKVHPGDAVFDYPGWVSAKYLRPVTLCPECGGQGYVGDIEEPQDCPKCKAKGYIK
jgi:hypothetical protein